MSRRTRIIIALIVLGSLAALVASGSSAGARTSGPLRLRTLTDGSPARFVDAEVARTRRESAVRRRWLNAPAVRMQREASRSAYRNLSAAAAAHLALQRFGGSLASVSTPASSPAVAGHVLRYVGAFEAIVRSGPGTRRLAISSVPLLARRAGGGTAPVNLSLHSTERGFVPADPIEAVVIGSRLGEGMSVGGAGLRLTMSGADVAARQLRASTVFYANVAADTDAAAVPTSLGAELYAILRSPRSPQQLRYSVSLPSGASLVQRAGGAAAVVRGREVLANIPAPAAVDAQGSAVPVTMVVVGDSLVLRIAHRAASFAYPVLVDPQVNYKYSWATGGWTGQGPFIKANQQNYFSGDPMGISAASGPYQGSPNDWVSAQWTGSPGVVAPYESVSWTLYDVNLEDGDTTGTINQAQINLSDTCYNWQASLTAGGGQSYIAGEVSGQFASCQSGSTYPDLQNWILNSTGTASGGALALIGSFLFTIPCGSGCPTNNDPSGSAGWGKWNPAGPEAPRANCGNWPVNCANGNQFEVQTDLVIPGRAGLDLTRTYNSQAAAESISSPFGMGWTSSYLDSLAINQSAGTATVTQSNGSTVPFTINGSSFVAPPWAHATLVQNNDGTYTYTLANQESFHFDASGHLLSEADRNGETDTLSYDPQGQLSTITDPAGRAITLAYNPDGTVASATDSAGRVVDYTYSNGNLTGVTDADGGTWSFGYDASHQMTSETDPRGHTVTTSYNAANQVASQTDPKNQTRTWTYSAGETLVQNPDSTETDEHFSGLLLTSITSAYGTSLAATTSFAYDASDDLAAITDPKGNVTSYVYDSAGNLLRITDPLSRVWKWTYDSLNDVTSATDPNGVTTSYTYDSHGNLLSSSAPLAGGSQTQTWTFTRADSGHPGDVTAVTDPGGNTTSYTYDSYGDVTSVTDPLGNQTTYGHDTLGRITSMVTPRGNVPGANPSSFTTTYGYDALSRLTSETDPLGNKQKWGYDGDGNLVSYTDADNNTTSYTYDPDNELTTVTRPDGTTLQSSYDAAGNLTGQTNGAGHTTSYGYDALERVASVTDPLSRKTTYGYDAAGNLTSVTDPQGRTTTYGYNAANQLTSISYSDGKTPNVTYGYDNDGRRISMTDGTGTSSYVYDSLGRMTSTTDGHGDKTSFGYDLADNQTSITYPNSQTVTRSYDKADNLSSVTDWLGNTTSFAYDPDTNLQTTTFPSATSNVDTNTYDDADQLTGIGMSQGTTTLASLSYTRDPNGLLTKETQAGLPGAASTSYTYNQLDQLATAGSNTYSYDQADDLAKVNAYTASYDNANELTGFTGSTYGYDSLGERTTKTASGATTNYGYDQAGRLTAYTPPSGTATSYAYNGDGLRSSKTTGSTTSTFSWDQTSGIPLLLSDGQNSYIYGPQGLPIEQINKSGTPSYLHHDQLGSTRLITSQSGSTTATASYAEYGKLAGYTGTGTTPFGYAGQYTDSETGFQYDQARYYDPNTAQFITRDPLQALSREPYAYTNDNPINFTDPSGLGIFDDIGNFLQSTGISDAAAGLLNGLTGGLSNQIAGSVLGFNANCASYGTVGDIAEIGGFGFGLLDGETELGAATEGGSALAEGVGEGLVRHYTTDEGAAGIIHDGVIDTSGDGNVYLTTDRYSSGTEAQAGLNLSRTPTGYFEVPRSRIPNAVGPFPVDGGTGTEILNPGPIDATGLPFNPF